MLRLICIAIYVFMSLSTILLFKISLKNKSFEAKTFRYALLSTVLVNILYLSTIIVEDLRAATWVYSIYFSAIDIMIMLLMNYFFAQAKRANRNKIFRVIRTLLYYAIAIDVLLLMSNPFTGIEVSFYEVTSPLVAWDFSSYPLYKVHLSICYISIALSFIALLYESSKQPKLYKVFYERMMGSILAVVLLNAAYLLMKDILIIDISVAFYSILGYLVYWNSFEARDKYLLGRLQTSVFEEILQPVFLFSDDNKLVFSNKNAKSLLRIDNCETLNSFLECCDFGDNLSDLNQDKRLYWTNSKVSDFSYICDFKVLTDKKSRDIIGRFFIFTENTLGVDLVTNYHTQAYFYHHINELLSDGNICIAVSDLNRLTLLNNTVGREGGDKALHKHAQLLREIMPRDAIFVRLQDAVLCCISRMVNQEQMKALLIKANEELISDNSFPFHLSFNFALTQADKVCDVSKAINKILSILKTRKLLDSDSDHSSVIDSLHQMLLECDTETELHVRRTRELGEKLSYILGLTDYERDQLSLLCLFHDIGKVGVPRDILIKPAKLTDSEREIMRTHAVKGYRIAKATPELNIIAPAILHHHENWDGSGYPDGLKYEDIPLLSRVISVVDSYDAMVSDRPYRKAMSQEKALNELKTHAGTQFDPYIVDCFLSLITGNKDISVKTENEEQLFDNHELTNLVTPVLFSRYEIGQDNIILNVDKQFEHMTGYSQYDVERLKLTQNDLIFEEDREAYWNLVNQESIKGIVYIEHRIKRFDGTGRYVYCTGVIENGHTTVIVSDITDSVSVQLQVGLARNRVMMSLHRLEESNQKDPLTGALNRSAFKRHAEHLLSLSDSRYLLLMIDIDNFKRLNDTYGHPRGDKALQTLALILKEHLPAGSLSGRMGGDEFCCLIKIDNNDSLDVINKKLEELKQNIVSGLANGVVKPTVSMGVVCTQRDATEFDIIYEKADEELYKAKREGKNCFKISE